MISFPTASPSDRGRVRDRDRQRVLKEPIDRKINGQMMKWELMKINEKVTLEEDLFQARPGSVQGVQ